MGFCLARLQEWSLWEESCGRLGRVLDESEAFISSGAPEGHEEEEEESVLQHRLTACQVNTASPCLLTFLLLSLHLLMFSLCTSTSNSILLQEAFFVRALNYFLNNNVNLLISPTILLLNFLHFPSCLSAAVRGHCCTNVFYIC